MNEPPVKIWVRGAERYRYEDEWPILSKTKWTKYYLGIGELLVKESQPVTNEEPDTLNYEPIIPSIGFPTSPMPKYLKYSTSPLEKDIEIIGPIVLSLQASLDSNDGDFICVLKDVSPDGSGFNLTRGWLRASHRELDENESKPWKPYHVHTNPKPVLPGEVIEYAIEIQPIANLFKANHRIQLEIWPCDYPAEPYYDWTLFWGVTHHIPYGKPVTYKIYHTPQHLSYLLLPQITSG